MVIKKLFTNSHKKILFLLLFSVFSQVLSVSEDQVNEVTLPVNDRSQQSFNQALPVALGDVISKMSGNPQATSNSAIKAKLNQPLQWLNDYHYNETTNSLGNGQLTLTFIFDSEALHNLLQQYSTTQDGSIPVGFQEAGEARASSRSGAYIKYVSSEWQQQGQSLKGDGYSVTSILLWIQFPDDMQTIDASNQKLNKKLLNQGKLQGFDFLFPEMDLEDEALVGPNQNLLFDDDVLQKLIARYHVQSILVGKLQRGSDGSWLCQWKLKGQGDSSSWEQKENTLDNLTTATLLRLTNQFKKSASTATATTDSNNISNTNANSSSILLKISDVHSLSEYTAIMNYLHHLPNVTDVDVDHTDTNNLFLRVQAIGGQAVLVSVLETSSKFYPLKDKNNQNLLNYRWIESKAAVGLSSSESASPQNSSIKFIDDHS